MQEIGEDLVNILDVMRVKVVVGLAEGAGANALLRFGAMHVSRCLGIVCINPNPAAPTMIGGFLVRSLYNMLPMVRKAFIFEIFAGTIEKCHCN